MAKGVTLAVGVCDGVGVTDGVDVGEGVGVKDAVGVAISCCVLEGNRVGKFLGVAEGDGDTDWVTVAVALPVGRLAVGSLCTHAVVPG